ncbi:hypothetical protein DFQ30_011394 [Apophysomyces sp. BC1015]|nr:hypothetical protein DFQ30_011394 [Apophysomyces sp. BC1015]
MPPSQLLCMNAAKHRIRSRSRISPSAPVCDGPAVRIAYPRIDPEHRRVAQHHRKHVETAERQRRRANADLDVIVPIDHRIGRIVRNRPEHVRCEHQPCERRDMVLYCGEAHWNTEAERNPEVRLRNRKKALHERIRARHEQRRERQPLRQRIQRQDQQEGHQRERSRHGKRLPRDRAILRTLHVLVDIAVRIVVDCASGRTHQHGANRKDRNDMDRRMARIERRPQQQHAADRLVQPDKAEIQRQSQGENVRWPPVAPVSSRCVRYPLPVVVRLELPQIFVHPAGDLGEQVRRSRIAGIGRGADRLLDLLAVLRQRIGELPHMVLSILELERVRHQRRLAGDLLNATVRGAAERDQPLGAQVRPFDSSRVDFVEQQMQRDELRALDVPMRLLGLPLQVDCRDERLAEQADRLAADVLGQRVTCGMKRHHDLRGKGITL